jgi:uncharacterized protein
MKKVLLILIILLHSHAYPATLPSSYTLNTLYGNTIIIDPALIELIHSNAMQRLQRINQYGIMYFLNPKQEYTRYQHSLGVLYLLIHFGASREEQIMGLLHDVSHTAFSHVADYIFGTVQCKESYQDQIFEWYIAHTDILPILNKHHLENAISAQARSRYTMLKDDLPNLCADRLEYNLYGAYIEGWLNQEEICSIINHLHYADNQWFFDEQESAQQFAQITLDLSSKIWCAPYNGFIYTQMAQLLKEALALHLISMDDLTFSDDATIWKTLTASNNPTITMLINRLINYQTSFKVGTLEQHDFYVKGKLRGIDPLIIQRDGLHRLSTVNASFKVTFEKTKSELAQGWYISYTQ